MTKENLLMVLGPVEIEEDILQLGAKKQEYNRTNEYSLFLNQIYDNLKYLFQTQNPVFFTASSGTGIMEGVVTNLFCQNDTVLYINGGTFGARWGKICNKYKINTIEIKLESGQSVTPEQINETLKQNPEIKAVLLTQNETSTGTLTDIEAIAKVIQNYPNTISVVDCISSLVTEKMQMDDWGIDVIVSASQKALAIPPGLGFWSMSKRALSYCEKSDLKGFYFDTIDYLENQKRNQTPFTPPISLLYQLERRLEKIKTETLDNTRKRYSELTRYLRDGLTKLGLKPLAKNCANCTTAIMIEGVDASEVVKIMNKKYNISIAPSGGEMKTKLFRVGNFGHIDKTKIDMFSEALNLTLNELGYKK